MHKILLAATVLLLALALSGCHAWHPHHGKGGCGHGHHACKGDMPCPMHGDKPCPMHADKPCPCQHQMKHN